MCKKIEQSSSAAIAKEDGIFLVNYFQPVPSIVSGLWEASLAVILNTGRDLTDSKLLTNTCYTHRTLQEINDGMDILIIWNAIGRASCKNPARY